jgi:hypothetical protein
MGCCKGKNSFGKLNYQLIITPEEENSPGLGVEFLNCLDESLKIIQDTPGIYQKAGGARSPIAFVHYTCKTPTGKTLFFLAHFAGY